MIIFVGDKPSPKMKPGVKPFQGAACEARISEWISYIVMPMYIHDYKIYNSSFASDIENILYYYNNPSEIPYMRAKVIALGNNASRRLTACHINHFKLPHPSGRNIQINGKEFIGNKLKECREWLSSK